MKNVKPIEYLGIYDNLMWCDLAPQYPGYQLSNTGIIRSMKFYKKYPYGIIIESNNGIVKISNSLNQTEQINIEDLMKRYTNFNIPTSCIYHGFRNPIITSKSNHMKKKLEYKNELQKPSGFHFKIIDQNN